MEVTLHIPDEIAQRLRLAGQDLSRRALEAFALEEYEDNRITADDLRRVLGFGTCAALNDFLKEHGVIAALTPDDLEQQRRQRAREAAQAIREMSKGVTLGGLKIKDLISEGRR